MFKNNRGVSLSSPFQGKKGRAFRYIFYFYGMVVLFIKGSKLGISKYSKK